jgi:uncharacterized protein (DUF342 family)
VSEQQNQSEESKPDGQRFYHAKTGYQLILSLSKDEMECRAHLEVKTDGTPPSIEELKGYLAADAITTGINEESLSIFISEAVPGKSTNALLASGIFPGKGSDGNLEYSFVSLEPPPVSSSDHTDDTKTQQVDFRVVQQFINVEPDQEIGRIIQPSDGIPGKTVRGKSVPSEPGKPLMLKLGQNVRAGGENSEILYAEIHGRVKYDDDTLHVVEEYIVDGNVDFSVGNIRFNGFVEVKGDVLDGFQVSASKGLKITGNVGNCKLTSHGNIEFCGMDGQGTGSILCGGNLTAHFIHDSTVECWGNTLVDVELRNCNIHCRGTLVSGVLSGGNCVTLAGVELKKLGAPSAIKTSVHSGVDYHNLDRLEILLDQIGKLQEQLGSTKDMQELKQLTDKKQQLTRLILELRNKRAPGSNPKVNIKDRIYEGATICLGNTVELFTKEESGPVSLIENSLHGGLRRLSMSSLQIMADELEKASIQHDEEEIAKVDAAESEKEQPEQIAETDKTTT